MIVSAGYRLELKCRTCSFSQLFYRLYIGCRNVKVNLVPRIPTLLPYPSHCSKCRGSVEPDSSVTKLVGYGTTFVISIYTKGHNCHYLNIYAICF